MGPARPREVGRGGGNLAADQPMAARRRRVRGGKRQPLEPAQRRARTDPGTPQARHPQPAAGRHDRPDRHAGVRAADREAFRRAAGRSLDGALLARPRPGSLAAPGGRRGGHRRGTRADRERPGAAARRKVVRQVAGGLPALLLRRHGRDVPVAGPGRPGAEPRRPVRIALPQIWRDPGPVRPVEARSPADRRDGDPENPRSLRAPRDGTRRRAHAPDRALPAPPEVRREVERAPARDGPPEGRHRAARLRAGGPEGGIHARGAHALRQDEGVGAAGGVRPRPQTRDRQAGGRPDAEAPDAARRRRSVAPAGIWGGAKAVHAESAPSAAAQTEAAGIRKQQRAAIDASSRAERPEPIKAAGRVGRNDPCPCGSGKKFKKCCGKTG